MELIAGREERQNACSMGEPRQQPCGAGTLWEGRGQLDRAEQEPSCVPASGGTWEVTLLSDNGWL